jgi:hypothetical protein
MIEIENLQLQHLGMIIDIEHSLGGSIKLAENPILSSSWGQRSYCTTRTRTAYGRSIERNPGVFGYLYFGCNQGLIPLLHHDVAEQERDDAPGSSHGEG